MKHIYWLLGWLISLAVPARGQVDTGTYRFAEDIEAALRQDTTAWKYQTGAVSYSFAGDYRNALITWDEGMNTRIYTPTGRDSAILEDHRPVNAQSYILARAVREQIIVINEAHHNPRHRVFTGSLLEGLYEKGYRYLGLEGIFDSLVNERNYAIAESGYYTREPEFGNLVREARRLGFIVFGYEAPPGINGKEREIAQARNIQRFIDANPPGKLIVHCGFDHVYEDKVAGWEKAMAGRLKEYTGVDPFTVDQVRYSERSRSDISHYFLYATQEKQSFVLVDPDSTVFNGFSEPRQTDIAVVHPLTDYKDGRPDWLSDGRTEYRLPAERRSSYAYPVLILAYRAGEYESGGIPADLAEIGAQEDNRPLCLQKGAYTIVVLDRHYSVSDTFDIRVE